METTYDHNKYERKWWDFWTKNESFKASSNSQKPAYSVLIPPPNVTDRLHMGHGLNNTLQDILVRWKRMQGHNCCWLPGTDHAGIATQMMVEKALKKEGLSRQEIGRDKFVKRCVEWKEKNGDIITSQLKRLGASCDWSREAYTMDPSLSKAVRQVFVKLYKDGLIYQGNRLVNWDPVLKTAISDDEVETKEVQGSLWHIRYELEGRPGEFLTVATTRPETMLGDTALAVHPDDERYKKFIGSQVVVPIAARSIRVIADEHVKKDFGTGCLKITPAHDPNDFEIGKKHQLESIDIFDEGACLNELCPVEYQGLSREVARKKIIVELKKLGVLEKVESIRHAVPFSERSKVALEPRLSKQWYVKMQPLAKPAIEAAKQGDLRFFPDSWKKTYLHWLENVEDWCISRQLWWGHRIPIWTCVACEKIQTGVEDPNECQSCGAKELAQDSDVLDTWFSSWLWPLSPFGWPRETKDLEQFFPSAVLVTGPDIIYLWVARMIMASYYLKGQLPFKDVYFNAIICDKEGRKFSKTLGNGIDPLEVIERFGADAVRYTCVSLAPLGGRVKLAAEDFENGHRFVNKLWNSARFLKRYLGDKKDIGDFDETKLASPFLGLLKDFYQTTSEMNHLLTTYQINEAVEKIFHLAWRNFCDWGLEAAKPVLEGEQVFEKEETLSCLLYVFEGILRLLAPIMPFITEEIWQKMTVHPRWIREKSLATSSYPKPVELEKKLAQKALQWGAVQTLVSGVRSLRTQAKIIAREKLTVWLECTEDFAQNVKEQGLFLETLAGLKELKIKNEQTQLSACLVTTGKGWTLYLPVGDGFDLLKEQKRLEAESQRIEKIVIGLDKRLNNPQYRQRAPKEVVVQAEQQRNNMKEQLASLLQSLSALSS